MERALVRELVFSLLVVACCVTVLLLRWQQVGSPPAILGNGKVELTLPANRQMKSDAVKRSSGG